MDAGAAAAYGTPVSLTRPRGQPPTEPLSATHQPATSDGAGQAGPQQLLTSACAEADRLQALADQEQTRLREARRQRATYERESEQGLALSDPRRLSEAKREALHLYQADVRHAVDRPRMLAGSATYLRTLTRLNRAARRVSGSSHSWSSRLRQLDEQIHRLELAADSARVAADTAREKCLEARRAVVSIDESLAPARPLCGPSAHADELDQPIAIEIVLGTDRAAFKALVVRLAEDVGLDASRLQLLLLELRQALYERARAAAVLAFPADNDFWAQFTVAEARAVAAALEVINRGFDGRGGWQGGRAAEPREVAIAVSMAGREPRLLRVRPTRAELEKLWRGTTIEPLEYVRERSPDLALETFEPLVGPKAAGLAELWDNWGRLRRLMLSPASTA